VLNGDIAELMYFTTALTTTERDDIEAQLYAKYFGAPLPALWQGCVAYWPLNETSGLRFDVAGANPLTDVNTVTSNPGKISTAGQFVAASTEYPACRQRGPVAGGVGPHAYGLGYIDSRP
jgi:hypothetical protein